MKVFAESCVVVCLHKLSIQPIYDLALHQSACCLLGTGLKKEQQSMQSIFRCQKAAIRELQPSRQRLVYYIAKRLSTYVSHHLCLSGNIFMPRVVHAHRLLQLLNDK